MVRSTACWTCCGVAEGTEGASSARAGRERQRPRKQRCDRARASHGLIPFQGLRAERLAGGTEGLP